MPDIAFESGRVDKRSASTTVIGGCAALIRPTSTIVLT
jgi:hypothetical protein